ncbi:hypothetical protein pb186bvf_021056 [Paramecium bursaria]
MKFDKEIKELLKTFLEVLGCEQNNLRSQLKNVIAELIYQYRNYFSDQDNTPQGIVAGFQQFQQLSLQDIKKNIVRLINVPKQESAAPNQNLFFIQELVQIYKTYQQPQVLAQKDLQQIPMNQFLESIQNMKNQQLNSQVQIKTVDVMCIKLYENLLRVKSLANELLFKYSQGIQVIDKMVQQFQEFFKQIESQGNKFKINQIDKSQLQMNIQKSQDSYKIKSLFMNEQIYYGNLIYQDSINLQVQQELKKRNLQLIRISQDQVQYYQRFILSHIIRKVFFKSDFPLGLVIRIQAKQLNVKNNKYFLLTQIAEIEQQIILRDKNSFAKQFLASLCTDCLDSVNLIYSGDMKANFKTDQQNAQPEIYEFLKNPIFFFQNLIFDEKFQMEELKLDIQQFPIYWIKFLKFLEQMNGTGFSYPQISTQQKDFSQRKRSLQLSSDFIELLFKRINRVYQFSSDILEVAQVEQQSFRLVSAAKKVNSVIFQFCQIQKDFVQLEKYIEHINTQLNQYQLQPDHNVDNCFLSNIEKKISSELDKIANIKTKIEVLNQKSYLKHFISSPGYCIYSYFRNLELDHQISFQFKYQLVIYFAKSGFFVKNNFKYFMDPPFQKMVQAFKDSWKEQQLWLQLQAESQNGLKTNKNILFLELLGLLLKQQNFQGPDCFKSLQYIKESSKNIEIIQKYLTQEVLRGDLGYGQQLTITEAALLAQKFNLVLQLLQQKEGKRIQSKYFDYLIEYQYQGEQEYMIVSTILKEIKYNHPNKYRRLRWNHVWTHFFSEQNEHECFIFDRSIIYLQKIIKNPNIPDYLELYLERLFQYSNKFQHEIMFSPSNNVKSILKYVPKYPFNKYMGQKLVTLLELDRYFTFYEVGVIEQKYYGFSEIIDQSKSLRSNLVIDKDFNRLIDKIGQEQLGIKILLFILLLPSKILLETEILLDGQVPISVNLFSDPQNDQFFNSTGFQKQYDSCELKCQVVYFLSEIMNNIVPKNVLQHFRNVNSQIMEWLQQLQKLRITIYSNQQHLFFPITKDIIINLIRRGSILQQADENLTYLDLLKRCDWALGLYYESLLKVQDKDILEKQEMMLQGQSGHINYQELLTYHIVQFYDHFEVNQICHYQQIEIQNVIGPSKALKKALKYDSMMNCISQEQRIKFIDKLTKLTYQQYFFEFLNPNEDQKHGVFSKIKKFSEEQQNLLKYVSLRYLPQTLKLNDYTLCLINVTHLNLDYVKIYVQDFQFLTQNCKVVNFISMKHNTVIEGIYQWSAFTKSQLLVKNIKTLILDGCTNMKEINLNASSLINLSLNGCVKLQDVILAQSEVNRINVLECKSLREEHLQIWILSGKTLLFDGSSQSKYYPILNQESSKKGSQFKLTFTVIRDIYKVLKFATAIPQIAEIMIQQGEIDPKINNVRPSLLDKQLQQSCIDFMVQGFFGLLLQNSKLNSFDLSEFQKYDEESKLLLQSFTKDILQIEQTKFLQFVRRIERFRIPQLDKISLQLIMERLFVQINDGCERQNICLDISKRSFDGSTIKLLQCLADQNIQQRFSVKQINISANNLSPKDLQEISVISYMERIESLNIYDCGIDDTGIVNLLIYNSSLNLLDLSKNKLMEKGANFVFEQIGDSQIRKLILNYNKIGNAAFSQLFQKINKQSQLIQKSSIQVPVLDEISLQGCFYQQDNITQFTEFLDQKRVISTLDLRDNDFSDQHLKQLGMALSKNTSIICLKFGSRQGKIDEILIGLQSNTTLQELHLDLTKCQTNYYNLNILMMKSKISAYKLKVKTLDIIEVELILNGLKAGEQIKNFEIDIVIQNDQILLQLAKIKSIISQRRNLFKLAGSTVEHIYRPILFVKASQYCHIGLSIDGGGMRGIIPATIINYICTQIGYEPYQIFDVIGGTSIGGILALGMTGRKRTFKGEIKPIADKDEIIKIFTQNGARIFNQQKRNFIHSLFKSKYEVDGLEQVLSEYFGDVKLSETLPGVDVVVTAVHHNTRTNSSKKFSSIQAKYKLRKDFLMKDVGRATSAAPTFFSAAKIKSLANKTYTLVDGGMGQNNPSNLVLSDLQKRAGNDVDKNNFFLLSLSTGQSKQLENVAIEQNIFYIQNIVNQLGTSNQDFIDRELQTKFEGKYLRIKTEYEIRENEAQLDCTDPNILDMYKRVALETAAKVLNEQKFGKYKDQSILQWLKQNTEERLKSR